MACLLYAIIFFLVCCRSELGLATDAIASTQSLKDPEGITSSNGIFKLGFFTPSNTSSRYVGIWYIKVSVMNIIWVANRNHPINDTSGVLRISDDGNLQVMNGRNQILWSSNVSIPVTTNSSTIAQLQDSGNLVLFQVSDSKTTIWQSYDHPTDSIVLNMKLTFTQNSNMDRLLQSWKTPSDPSVGNFSLGIDSFALPQIIIRDGDRRYWRSGYWNGNQFSGIQYSESDNYIISGFILATDRQDTMSISYSDTKESLLSNFALTYRGTMVQQRWDDGKREWKVAWQAPETDCDFYGKCGEYGICNSKNKPICRCLDGFEPKNKEEWSRGNWSNGCIRRTNLGCGTAGGQDDGFLKLEMIKVPDYAQWLTGLDDDECESQCLKTCSCIAYVYDSSIGCMTWSRNLTDIQEFAAGGMDFHIRLAKSEIGKVRKVRTAAIVAGILGAAMLAIFLCLVWRWMVRTSGNKVDEKKLLAGNDKNKTQQNLKLDDLPLFNLESLEFATNYFHESHKLGRGGFGPVYRGRLEDGQEIAVKRLSRASGQGLEEFMNEVVVISKLQHRNLVRLLGCCVDGQERMLVYEYMPNKSLDAFLFDIERRKLLNWERRYDIIQGIIRGLLYLHRDSRLKIIHRDLKASNILLDEHLNPKISDFGLARIVGGNEDQANNTKRVVGTYGYMAPEYAMEGQFSEKSDVFSFGVVLLEMVSGRKNSSSWYEEQSLSLLGYAWKLWKDENISLLIDPMISDTCFLGEILKCIQVGLLCVQEHARDRPYIYKVISMLKSEVGNVPRPKQPGFTQRDISSSLDGIISQQEQQSSSSVNDFTVTNLTAR